MPWIADDADPLIENLLAEFCFTLKRGIWAAAFVSASCIEAKANQIVRRLRFENDWINSRFERARRSRCERLLNCLAADARGVEFRHVEVVSQKITGASAIRRAR